MVVGRGGGSYFGFWFCLMLASSVSDLGANITSLLILRILVVTAPPPGLHRTGLLVTLR